VPLEPGPDGGGLGGHPVQVAVAGGGGMPGGGHRVVNRWCSQAMAPESATGEIRMESASAVVMAEMLRPLRSCQQWQK